MQPFGGERQAPYRDAGRRLPGSGWLFQCLGRQIPLHAVADLRLQTMTGNYSPPILTQDHRQIQPPLMGPDKAYPSG
jgi:hypothetical protein